MQLIVLHAWNAEKIKVHAKFPSDAETVLEKLIAEFSLDDVLKGIQVYGEVFRRKDTFFNWPWTLSEFLRRKNGCRVFMCKTVEDYLTAAQTKPGGRTFEAQREQEGKFDD